MTASQSNSAALQVTSAQPSSLNSNLPKPVGQYFNSVGEDGLPLGRATKAQPWKARFAEEEQSKPTEVGKIVVACPKLCNYGSNVLGGL